MNESERFTSILDHDKHEYAGAFAVKIAAETGQLLPITYIEDAKNACHTLDIWFPILIQRARSTEFPVGEDALEATISTLNDLKTTISYLRLQEFLRCVPPETGESSYG